MLAERLAALGGGAGEALFVGYSENNGESSSHDCNYAIAFGACQCNTDGMTDPRGPMKLITKVQNEGYEQRQYVTLECGHTHARTPCTLYKVGHEMHCFTCKCSADLAEVVAQAPISVPLGDKPKDELIRIIEMQSEELAWYVAERNRLLAATA